LTCLLVEKNDIKLKGSQAMADCLTEHNEVLTALDLQENPIGDFGAQGMAKVLAVNGALKRLDLRQTEMTDVGVRELAEACREAKAIEELDVCQNEVSEEVHELLNEVAADRPSLALYHIASAASDENGYGEQIHDDGADYFEEAMSPPDELQEAALPATVQRMLGIIEDKDDIAFDNACWYLNSQPEIAEELWRVALDSGDASQVRCLEIARHVLQQTISSEVLIRLEGDKLPPATHAIYKHLPDIVNMLRRPPVENISCTTTFGKIEQRLGLLRIRAIDVIAELIGTRNAAICNEVATLDALPIVFDKFFEYNWNSALHSTVLSMVQHIFDVEDGGGATNQLQKRLLDPVPEGCGLLARLMSAYNTHCPETIEFTPFEPPAGDNQEPVDPASAEVEQKLVFASQNVGFMSSVIEMASVIKQAWQYSLFVRELVDASCEGEDEATGVGAQWKVFCTDVLDRVADMSPEKRCLGGEKPRPNPTCGQM